MMEARKYEYQSDFAKKYIALGEAEGEAKGKAKGRAEGEAEGKANAVLAVLAARGLAISDAQHTRVLAEKDLAVLDRWITRAATCASADEALSDEF